MLNRTNAHIHAIQEITIARKIIARLWAIENAPSGTSFPVALALAGIKENRVEEVAAVATQAVINPTPVMTCPATKAEVVVALLKMHIPPIIVMIAADSPQQVKRILSLHYRYV